MCPACDPGQVMSPNCKVGTLLLLTLEMNRISALCEKGNYDIRLNLSYRIKEKKLEITWT